VRVLLAAALLLVAVCAPFVARAALGNEGLRLAALDRHRLLAAVILAAIAAMLVARRRTFERAETLRSWLAAVPVRTSRARWESVVLASAPALVMMIAVLLLAAIVPWPAAAGLVGARLAGILIGGIVMGAVVGYMIPEAKVFDLPPGSRYVPHRRVAARTPRPSMSPLGLWPVRRLFASVRPQAVTRAALPLLLAIPLGSTADIAMLLIGIVVALAATLLLVTAILAVSKAAARWMLPLPVRAHGVARRVLLRPLGVLLLLASVTAWLLWVGGMPAQSSAQRGLLLFAVAAASAIGGSLVLIGRAGRGGL
jgi:hypothetical protein